MRLFDLFSNKQNRELDKALTEFGLAMFPNGEPDLFSVKTEIVLLPSDGHRVEFEVQRTHLLDALRIEEIEAREMVHDSHDAVPHIPFGHLNDAWRQYVEKISDDGQSWSFQARLGKPRNTTSDYAGYAILRHDNIATFSIASRNT